MGINGLARLLSIKSINLDSSRSGGKPNLSREDAMHCLGSLKNRFAQDLIMEIIFGGDGESTNLASAFKPIVSRIDLRRKILRDIDDVEVCYRAIAIVSISNFLNKSACKSCNGTGVHHFRGREVVCKDCCGTGKADIKKKRAASLLDSYLSEGGGDGLKKDQVSSIDALEDESIDYLERLMISASSEIGRLMK